MNLGPGLAMNFTSKNKENRLFLFLKNPISHRPMRIQTYIYNNMIDSAVNIQLI